MIKKLFGTAIIIFILQLIYINQADAAFSVSSYHYKKTARPGENIVITLRVFNNTAAMSMYTITTVLTTRSTLSFEFSSGLIVTRANERDTVTISVQAPQEEGVYSVSLILDGSLGGIAQVLRQYGTYPIVIGNPRQSINAHPSRVNFGRLHEGRFMYPIPIKIRYKVFSFNDLGDVNPWTIRIYSDNANKYTGIGALTKLSPAGLVHSSGKYAVQLKFWNLNWGPDAHATGWDPELQGPPPIEDDLFWKGALLDESTPEKNLYDVERQPWLRIHDYSEMTNDIHHWRRCVGVYTYDGQFINPTNTTGDFTLSVPPDPFEIYLAVEIGSTAVRGKYTGRLVLELFSP